MRKGNTSTSSVGPSDIPQCAQFVILLGELQGSPSSRDLCPQKVMGNLLGKQQQFRKHYLFIYLAKCSFSEKSTCFKGGPDFRGAKDLQIHPVSESNSCRTPLSLAPACTGFKVSTGQTLSPFCGFITRKRCLQQRAVKTTQH